MAKTIEHQTNLFCWRRGFKAKDLGDHPCADDLILMTKLKDELGQYLSNEDHCWLNGIWGYVYIKKFPLKNKHLEKIDIITTKAIRQETRHKQQLARIKTLRQAKV